MRQPVTRIELSDTRVTIKIDAKSIQLRAVVYPENALNKEVVWTSSNTQVARVNESGLATLVKPGEVTIIADQWIIPAMAMCNITIEVPVSTASIDEKDITMYVGETKRLSYSVLPVNATNTTVTWTSTRPNVASVDSSGRVTARQAGSTVIMLKTVDGGITAYCNVTVRHVAEGIKFSSNEIQLSVGETRELEYSLVPANATDSDIIWESSDTRVVVVDEMGKVTGKGAGTAFVIARTELGGLSYITVNVKQPVTGIPLNFSEKTIYGKDSLTCIGITEQSNLSVVYKSSNERVATVSEKGEVVGVSPPARITVTTVDGG